MPIQPRKGQSVTNLPSGKYLLGSPPGTEEAGGGPRSDQGRSSLAGRKASGGDGGEGRRKGEEDACLRSAGSWEGNEFNSGIGKWRRPMADGEGGKEQATGPGATMATRLRGPGCCGTRGDPD